MKLTRGDRGMLAAVMAGLAAMLLCFGARAASAAPLARLPWEPPAVEETTEDGRVDVNTAGLEELMTLPGIGESRAQAILDDRAANGPYRYPEDLLRVRGIGERILSGILDQITTGGEGDAQNFGG